MDNRFNNLKKSHPEIKAGQANEYPVLQPGEYQTNIIYLNNRDFIKIHTGHMDGVWVTGFTFHAGYRNGNNPPSRMWGDFENRTDAKLWALGEIERALQPGGALFPIGALRAIEKAIRETWFNKHQLTLFPE